MRKAAAGTDPDRPVRITQEGFGIAIVPNKAVTVRVALPYASVEYFQAMIFAHPDPPAAICANEKHLVRRKPRPLQVYDFISGDADPRRAVTDTIDPNIARTIDGNVREVRPELGRGDINKRPRGTIELQKLPI
jgi:hypothetical protein